MWRGGQRAEAESPKIHDLNHIRALPMIPDLDNVINFTFGIDGIGSDSSISHFSDAQVRPLSLAV